MITTIKELQKSNIQLPAWLNIDGRRYHVTDIKFCLEEVVFFIDKTYEGEDQGFIDYYKQEIDDTRISISENINEEEEIKLHPLIEKDFNDIKKTTKELYKKIEALKYDHREEFIDFCRRIGFFDIIYELNSCDISDVISRVVRAMKLSSLRLETEEFGIQMVNLSHISQYLHFNGARQIILTNGKSAYVPLTQKNRINIYILDALFPKYD